MPTGPWGKPNAFLKRGFDIIAAGLLLLLASPLMLLAWIGIRLTSPGAIFYRAPRIGVNGAPFTMMKFRSMHERKDAGSAITAPGDARIFPFGRFMRATKIDELPQLLNILKGDMSWVGPRPEDPGIVERYYTDELRLSLKVRPGLTSPGTLLFMREFTNTVSAGDTEASYAANILTPKLRADIAYMDRQTVPRDLVIILETAWIVGAAILRGRSTG